MRIWRPDGYEACAFAALSNVPQQLSSLVHNQRAVTEWREDLLALLPAVQIVELPELDMASVQAEGHSLRRSAAGWIALEDWCARPGYCAGNVGGGSSGMSRND